MHDNNKVHPQNNNNVIPPKDAVNDILENTPFQEQHKDPYILKIIKDINSNPIPKFKNFILCDRSKLLLYHCNANRSDHDQEYAQYKIVVPQSLQAKCMKIHHILHYGIDKTYKNICRKFFWKGLHADVVNFVKSCHTCITNKPQRIPAAHFKTQ